VSAPKLKEPSGTVVKKFMIGLVQDESVHCEMNGEKPITALLILATLATVISTAIDDILLGPLCESDLGFASSALLYSLIISDVHSNTGR